MRNLLLLVLCVGCTAAAFAAPPTIDGRANDALYGRDPFDPALPNPIVIQDTQTGYGDSSRARPDLANGSELDAVYGVVYDNVLYLVFAGNFETNGNRLNIFFDTVAGGQNQLGPDNPPISALQRMSTPTDPNMVDPNFPGLTFKSGFEADYFLSINANNSEGVITLYADYAQIAGVGYYLGATSPVCGGLNGVLSGGDAGAPTDILVGLDNSNYLGVTGGFGIEFDGGYGVTTGMEIAIPLADIGNPTGDISIVAFIGNGGADSVSNQVFGGISAFVTANLAGGGGSEYVTDVRALDFSTIPPHMPFTVALADGAKGACCTGTTCEVLSPADCASAGGTYQGDNVSCYDNAPCDGSIVGRCCYVDSANVGQCAVVTSAGCDALAGTWTQGETCDGCACVLPPTGACCFTDSCSDDMFETDCVAAGGEYAGDFVACSSDPCQFGIAAPYIAGSFQDPQWVPDATPLTETAPGSGIWTHSATGLTADTRYEFKITDGTWDNTFPAANSWFYADANGDMTITYDTNLYDDGWSPTIFRLGTSSDPGTWTAAGNFQSEAGGSDWTNNDPVTALTPIGGGVNMLEVTLPAGSYLWKAVVTGTWDSISWDNRSINTGNWAFDVATDGSTVKFYVDGINGRARFEIIPPATVCPGDANCDGEVNFFDIDPFVVALTASNDASVWQNWLAANGYASDCDFLNNDTNGDLSVDFFDIDPFVTLLSTGATCP